MNFNPLVLWVQFFNVPVVCLTEDCVPSSVEVKLVLLRWLGVPLRDGAWLQAPNRVLRIKSDNESGQKHNRDFKKLSPSWRGGVDLNEFRFSYIIKAQELEEEMELYGARTMKEFIACRDIEFLSWPDHTRFWSQIPSLISVVESVYQCWEAGEESVFLKKKTLLLCLRCKIAKINELFLLERWNVRGLGNPETIMALRSVVRKVSPGLVFLSETKLLVIG
ncbi:hypothetical protein PanWU01x14_070770 [Parasponia andersonii]|uniref:DUF4283 domain-containing protein n=1 Tax=Parasponia andersonii TaxID=3476 RepID=A0A2P5DF46_PARAD|nr:hypothetical protein PanWU01x14_070770 [Parasponia andersonii]